jgi:uncharacterized protein (TIGR02246 family)
MAFTQELLEAFGRGYTAAWSSRDAARVANFYAENGSLQVNGGAPAIGRAAVAAVARSFIDAFPDLVLTMDGVELLGEGAVYRWTFEGTNTGPGGTGNGVRFSGREEWRFDAEGCIEESLGHFDSAEYERQIREGV